MKFVIFSDIHLHTYAGTVDPSTRISKRLMVQKNILQQIIDLSLEEEAILLFGGDLVHSVGTVPVEVLNVIDWFFKEIVASGIQFYAVEGNHDLSIRQNMSHWHSVLSPFQNREERDKKLAALKPSVKLVDYDNIQDAEDIKGFDIVVIHGQPELVNKHNHKMEGVNWKKVVKNNRMVFFGHDHTRRELSKLCYVVGSPLQLTMDDVGEERGCYVVDSENWSVTFHKLDYPELKKLAPIEAKEEEKFEERIKATSFDDILIEWMKRENKPQSYYDLIKVDISDKIQTTKPFFNGRIKDVYLKDFLSIEEIKVEIRNGFWLVLGSNGTGKTSVVGEGIYWVLFDETTKNVAKPEVIRRRPTKQKEAIGEVIMVDEVQYYRVRRSSKTGLEIWADNKNLVEGMTKIQAQAFLEKNVLGFDKHTYLASCYFSQEQLLTLAQLGDADTVNMVTNLLGFETYDALYKFMKQKIDDTYLQLQKIGNDQQAVKNEIFKCETEHKSVQENLATLKIWKNQFETDVEKITLQLSDLNSLYGKIEIPSVTTEELDVSLSDLSKIKNETSTKIQSLLVNGQKLQTEISTLEKKQILFQYENKSWNESLNRLEEQLTSLQGDGCLCPTCGQKIDTNIWKEKVDIVQNQIKAVLLKKPTDNIDQEYIVHIQESYMENNNTIAALQAEIKAIEEECQEIQKQRNTVLKAVTEATAQKDNYKKQIAQLESQLKERKAQLEAISTTVYEDKLKLLEEQVQNFYLDIQNLNDKTNILQEHKAIYEFWMAAFSNKGIRPLLLDRFVNEFNSIVLKYCYRVNGGKFIVQFTPTDKTQAGLERNKLGLNVVYNGVIEPYKGFSGGEKTRVNLPLCLGLNKWISQKYGLTNGIFGLIVLDEVFCWTDEDFRDNVADLLIEEGRTKSVFVIDHSDVLISYTDKLWQFSKENEVTQLQVV